MPGLAVTMVFFEFFFSFVAKVISFSGEFINFSFGCSEFGISVGNCHQEKDWCGKLLFLSLDLYCCVAIGWHLSEQFLVDM